jgi:uncharacterized protein YkwD
MAEAGRIWHTAHLARKLERAGISFDVADEIVGAALVGHLRALFRAFMASPDHRAVILEPRFRRVGIGVVRRGGFLWVTLVFYG